MRRREFIAGLSGALASPLTTRAQQSAMPVIGFLNAASPQSYARPLAAFLKVLEAAGYTDGRNVTIQFRWAEGHNDRLPAMAAELLHNHVNVLAATTTPAALAAKAATSTIPLRKRRGSDQARPGRQFQPAGRQRYRRGVIGGRSDSGEGIGVAARVDPRGAHLGFARQSDQSPDCRDSGEGAFVNRPRSQARNLYSEGQHRT